MIEAHPTYPDSQVPHLKTDMGTTTQTQRTLAERQEGLHIGLTQIVKLSGKIELNDI